MQNVLIFEDDLIIQRGISQLVVRIFFDNDQTVNVFNCSTITETVAAAEANNIDLFMLDVAIPGNSRAGIDLGVYIVSQKKYRGTPIIYITANPDTVFEAVNKTHCYKFLEKPFTESELADTIQEIIKTDDEKEEGQIELESMGKKYSICKKDILYIESCGHNVTLWMNNDVIVIKNISMRYILEKLRTPFIQCHKSFVVNMDYVKLIDRPKNELILSQNSKSVPIGRAFKNKLP